MTPSAAPPAAAAYMTPAMEKLLSRPPSAVFYGISGVGKSFASQCAFGRDFLFVVHDPEVLRAIASFIRMYPEIAKQKYGLTDIPEFFHIPGERRPQPGERLEAGACTVPVNCLATVEALVNKIALSAKNRSFDWKCRDGQVRQFRGIVFDEFSEFDARMSSQLQVKFGKDGFSINRELHRVQRKLRDISIAYEIAFVFICGESQPKFYATAAVEEGAKVAPEKQGQLQYLGGPTLPTGNLSSSVCGQVSFVFQFTVKDDIDMTAAIPGPKRLMLTGAGERWYRKGRDFGIPYEVDLSQTDLRELLARTGCIK